MDNTETKNQTQESENKEEENIKVTVTKKAEKLVMDLLSKVNDGFDGGRVNRQDLISWILTRFVADCGEQEIKAIRADHFDEMMLLELSLKRFKQAGALPPELRKFLLSHAGLDKSYKKAA